MPFWSQKNRDKNLSQEIVKQQRDTRGARLNQVYVSDRVACVIAILQDQPEWDYAISKSAAREAAIYAANYSGFIQPHDAEETAIFEYLTEHYAGRKIAMFAWGLYADQLRTEENVLLLVDEI